MKRSLNLLAIGVMAAALAAGPGFAQTGRDVNPPSPTSPYTTGQPAPGADMNTPGTGNYNFGWIGLIGLAGLLGLRRRPA